LRLACAGRGSRYILDGIGQELGRKAPDLAFVYRIVGRAIDLIDAPVVRRSQIKALGGSIARGALGDTAKAIVDVVEVITQVERVPVHRCSIFSWRPAKDHISWHIRRLISRAWVKSRTIRYTHHDLPNFFVG